MTWAATFISGTMPWFRRTRLRGARGGSCLNVNMSSAERGFQITTYVYADLGFRVAASVPRALRHRALARLCRLPVELRLAAARKLLGNPESRNEFALPENTAAPLNGPGWQVPPGSSKMDLLSEQEKHPMPPACPVVAVARCYHRPRAPPECHRLARWMLTLSTCIAWRLCELRTGSPRSLPLPPGRRRPVSSRWTTRHGIARS